MADPTRPPPLVITRLFKAPPATVFKAWSSAEHVKRWLAPEGFTIPEAMVDFRRGGAFDVCMRAPDGHEFWSRGHYEEVVPHTRIVWLGSMGDPADPKFTAHTTASFEPEGFGTRLTVTQVYAIYDPAFGAAVDGAPEGWRTALDRLDIEVDRIGVRAPAAHGMFHLERTYGASPARVFHALTDEAAKAKWFASSEGLTILERSMDVHPGGREFLSGRWASGTISTFDAVYFDVIPDVRLVYAYEMHLDGRKISVSLATMELKPDGAGTRLLVTEQGVFIGGYDDDGSREKGTAMLLDRLGASLDD